MGFLYDHWWLSLIIVVGCVVALIGLEADRKKGQAPSDYVPVVLAIVAFEIFFLIVGSIGFLKAV